MNINDKTNQFNPNYQTNQTPFVHANYYQENYPFPKIEDNITLWNICLEEALSKVKYPASNSEINEVAKNYYSYISQEISLKSPYLLRIFHEDYIKNPNNFNKIITMIQSNKMHPNKNSLSQFTQPQFISQPKTQPSFFDQHVNPIQNYTPPAKPLPLLQTTQNQKINNSFAIKNTQPENKNKDFGWIKNHLSKLTNHQIDKYMRVLTECEETPIKIILPRTQYSRAPRYTSFPRLILVNKEGFNKFSIDPFKIKIQLPKEIDINFSSLIIKLHFLESSLEDYQAIELPVVKFVILKSGKHLNLELSEKYYIEQHCWTKATCSLHGKIEVIITDSSTKQTFSTRSEIQFWDPATLNIEIETNDHYWHVASMLAGFSNDFLKRDKDLWLMSKDEAIYLYNLKEKKSLNSFFPERSAEHFLKVNEHYFKLLTIISLDKKSFMEILTKSVMLPKVRQALIEYYQLNGDGKNSNTTPHIFDNDLNNTLQQKTVTIELLNSDDEVIDQQFVELKPQQIATQKIGLGLLDPQAEAKQKFTKYFNLIGNTILESWFSKGDIKNWFTEQIIESRGIWSFSVDNNEVFDRLFAPLIKELKQISMQDQDIFLQALKEHLLFLNLYRISLEKEDSFISPGKDLIKSICHHILPIDIQNEKLSQEFSLEVSETLFQLKSFEYRIFISKINNPAKEVAERKIPCYLIDQDNENAHLKLMQACFNDHNYLDGLVADSDKMAQKKLHEINKNILIEQGNCATVSANDLSRLQMILEYSTETPFLLIERKKKQIAVASTQKNEIEIKSTNSNPQKINPTRTLKRPQPFDDEKSFKHSKINENGKRGSPITNKPSNNFINVSDDDLISKKLNPYSLPDNSYKAFNDILPKSASKDELFEELEKEMQTWLAEDDNNDNFKPIATKNTPSAEIDEFELLDKDNLWKSLSLRSLNSVNEKIKNRSVLKEVIINQRPLSYPILEKYSAHKNKPVEKFPICHKGLKQYQQTETQLLLNYARHGISRVLSFEMGLGKTFVYLEQLAQQVANNPQGSHLVIVPKSILDSIHKEMLGFFSTVRADAWLLRSKTESAEFLLAEYSEVLNNSLKNKTDDELIHLMQIYSTFSQENLYNKLFECDFYRNFSSANFKSLSTAINKHFASLQDKLSQDPNLLNKIEQIIINAANTNERFTPENQNACKTFLEKLTHEINKLKNNENAFNFPVIEEIKQLKFSYPVIHFYCRVASQLLNIESAGLNPEEHYKGDSLKRLSKFKSNFIVKTQNSQDLVFDKPAIFLTTYDCARKIDLKKVNNTTFSTIIVDEAQKMHTSNTDRHNWFQQFSKAVHSKDEKSPLILLVTATPFENNFIEMWNLLALSNPECFPQSAQNVLGTLNTETAKALTKIYTQPNDDVVCENAKHNLLKSFAYFAVFQKEIVHRFVCRAKKENPLVVDAWNGKIPTRVDKVIHGTMTEKTLKIYDTIEKDYRTKGNEKNIFKHTTQIEGLLIVADSNNSGSFNINNQEITKIIEMFQKGNPKQKDEFILNSPYLNALLTSKGFKNAIWKGQSVVVFTKHLATARILEAAINYKFKQASEKKLSPSVKVFHGGLKSNEREDQINWFKKKSEKPKVFVAMVKSGGVGFNLQEGNKVFLLLNEWNPGNEDQAVARIIRVGSEGVKKIYTIAFNIFLEDHCNAVQGEKRAWESFFWNDDQNYKDLFKRWCDVQVASCFHAHLNKTRDKESSLMMKSILESSVEGILEEMTEQDLQIAVKVVSPANDAPKAIVNVPTVKTLTVQSYIPFPLGSNKINKESYLEAVSCCYQSLNREDSARMAKIMQTTTGLRQKIREGVFQYEENPEIADYIESIKGNGNINFNNLKVEVYEFEDNKYVCKNTYNEAGSEVILLYRKKVREKDKAFDIYEPLMHTGT